MSECSEIRARHILVTSEEEAKELRQEIVDGKDFGHVARKKSQCPSSYNCGDLGFFRRGAMVPEFDEAAFSLPLNQVSEPVKTNFGWHLIMVTDKR